jgi:hypothetical protein
MLACSSPAYIMLAAFRIPHVKDTAKWKDIIYGPEAHKKLESAGAPLSGTSAAAATPAPAALGLPQNVLPVLSLLLHLDERTVNALLSQQIRWACKRPVTHLSGAWLYGLLARLEKPLDADVCADIRQLRRRCMELRAELVCWRCFLYSSFICTLPSAVV